MDESLPMADAVVSQARALVWLPADEQPLPLLADQLCSAMMVGMSEAVRDMSVEYAKLRTQFGQPIGAFQAVKHRCADMALHAEAAWSQTVFAALQLDAARESAAFDIATAKLIATHAALEGAAANIQNHGSIGFTAELQAHLFLKRAHVIDSFGGGARVQSRKVLTLRHE
ncbi:hypothetical protein BH09PSE5_BH09PSE5_33930 [soil metagenome]